MRFIVGVQFIFRMLLAISTVSIHRSCGRFGDTIQTLKITIYVMYSYSRRLGRLTARSGGEIGGRGTETGRRRSVLRPSPGCFAVATATEHVTDERVLETPHRLGAPSPSPPRYCILTLHVYRRNATRWAYVCVGRTTSRPGRRCDTDRAGHTYDGGAGPAGSRRLRAPDGVSALGTRPAELGVRSVRFRAPGASDAGNRYITKPERGNPPDKCMSLPVVRYAHEPYRRSEAASPGATP